jgi:enamine deaminase RidA (YjgF/YER057c/UK114 family)
VHFSSLLISSAVQVNNTLYLSGVVGLDNNTSKLVTGGIKEETEAVFQHIKNVLEESGSSLERGIGIYS